MVHLLWKSVWQFLKYLNAGLPHDPAILLQGVYSKELKTGLKQILVHQCTKFIAALFTIEKSWKWPSVHQHIKKHTICGIYMQWNIISHKKNSDVLIHATTLLAQLVKNLPAVQETWVRSLGWEDLLEEEMATHSSILAWKISWTEEPGGLQSMGLQSRAQLSD